MAQRVLAAVPQTLRGIAAGLRARARIVWSVTAAVFAFNLAAPVIILSLARRPVDFFNFNPWLSRLPEYLASGEPLAKKLSFLSSMAIAWVSADNKVEGLDWGFIVDVPTVARTLLTALVFGAYFALRSYRQRQREACGRGSKAAGPAGVAGALTTVFGLTTGPCTLAGCGVPVLPVVGLALTGLSSGTLTLFATLSRISIAVVLSLMGLAVVWLGWRIGDAQVHGTPAPH
ncbi:MAG TPA: hypothetical protein VN883_03910 [Myxococcales bacterium]|jgi:hypothetical protein|nr:hypothetical protein [Myxococcales bacterium]